MNKAWVLAGGLLSLAVGGAHAETAEQVLPELAPKIERSRQDLAGSAAGIEWVNIPGGKFTMGYDISTCGGFSYNDYPAHEVTVPSFEMAKTEVTFKQYAACVAAGKCTPIPADRCLRWGIPPERKSAYENRPVVCVTWSQAKDFAAFVGGRLPSEAEWVYAASSAGKNREYGEFMRNRHNFWSHGSFAPDPVCSTPESNTEQGLCDMADDVYELVEDAYHTSFAGAPADGSAWVQGGSGHVTRGASWSYCDDRLTPMHRSAVGLQPVTLQITTPVSNSAVSIGGDRDYTTGFRPVRAVSP